MISVIIPSFNRAALLKRAVEAFAGQQLVAVDLEIIVIDDGSTDDTASILGSLSAQYPQLKVVRQENQGRSVARNRGIDIASGDILFFSDDDMVPLETDFLVHHYRAQQDRAGAYVSHLLVPDHVVQSPFQHYWRRRLEADNQRIAGKRLGPGGFQFASLSLSRALLGKEQFSTAFQGYGWEDLELGYRLYQQGVRPMWLSAAKTLHEDRVHFCSHLEKYYQYGKNAWTFYSLHPSLSVSLWTGTHWLSRLIKRWYYPQARIARLPRHNDARLSDGEFLRCLETAYTRGLLEGALARRLE